MPFELKPVIWTALAHLALVVPLAAQPGGERLQQALSEVMIFRSQLMEDSTSFNACRVFEQTGRPSDFPAGIHRAARGLLDRSENPCGERQRVRSGTERIVELDSVRLSDSLAVVHLTIRKGENVYQETYLLPALTGSRMWGMREVRIWGARRFTPLPPSR